MSLTIRKLTRTSENISIILPNLLSLSNAIFCPGPGSKYASSAIWNERLSSASSVIIYLTPETSPGTPVAFLFAHPRIHSTPLPGGERESLHVWLAGVLPEMRKAGCLSRMMGELDSTPIVTVCTMPNTFPNMWRWLTNRGWTIVRDLGQGKVMLERRALGSNDPLP